jgi:hypothetical protein
VEGEAFLNYIWGLQPQGHVFLVRRLASLWQELPIDFTSPARAVALGTKHLNRGDLYFCANAFSGAHRRKESVLPSRLLYQDLDESDPRELPIVPELWWETSPGRWQAVWVLDGLLEAQELAQLNRALNRASHADPGTWNLTRLLRVPGSWNAKRECRVSRAYGTAAEEDLVA